MAAKAKTKSGQARGRRKSTPVIRSINEFEKTYLPKRRIRGAAKLENDAGPDLAAEALRGLRRDLAS
jgi:hypothetical protein